MQITFNQSEVEGILAAHVATYFPHIEPEAVASILVNEDGTALVIIGEEQHEPVVGEDKPVQRRRRRKANPAEAKHVPVEAKKELEQPAKNPTTVGGQSESSTLEAESSETQGEPVVEPTWELKEVATAEAEAAEPETATEQAAVEKEAEEAVVEEKPVTTKPSLFAGLKR